MYVYLLQSEKDSGRKYVGITHNIRLRFAEHNSGSVEATYKFRPWKLMAYTWIHDADTAVDFERYLKSGSGRAFAKRHFLSP